MNILVFILFVIVILLSPLRGIGLCILLVTFKYLGWI